MTKNALIGKAVEVCAKKNLAYLVYLYWTKTRLLNSSGDVDFKRLKSRVILCL